MVVQRRATLGRSRSSTPGHQSVTTASLPCPTVLFSPTGFRHQPHTEHEAPTACVGNGAIVWRLRGGPHKPCAGLAEKAAAMIACSASHFGQDALSLVSGASVCLWCSRGWLGGARGNWIPECHRSSSAGRRTPARSTPSGP